MQILSNTEQTAMNINASNLHHVIREQRAEKPIPREERIRERETASPRDPVSPSLYYDTTLYANVQTEITHSK